MTERHLLVILMDILYCCRLCHKYNKMAYAWEEISSVLTRLYYYRIESRLYLIYIFQVTVLCIILNLKMFLHIQPHPLADFENLNILRTQHL